jgi:hypothetical protein
MTTNNNVDSSTFTRDDVVRTTLVNQYFSGLLNPLGSVTPTASPYSAGTTTATFHSDDKYGGYTIAQIVTAMKQFGLLPNV